MNNMFTRNQHKNNNNDEIKYGDVKQNKNKHNSKLFINKTLINFTKSN